MKQPKTDGYIWLEHSFNAFNGTQYPDRSSSEAFVESYCAYKKWKNDTKAVKLVDEYYGILIVLASSLLETSSGMGSGHKPSPKLYEKFLNFKSTL